MFEVVSLKIAVKLIKSQKKSLSLKKSSLETVSDYSQSQKESQKINELIKTKINEISTKKKEIKMKKIRKDLKL